MLALSEMAVDIVAAEGEARFRDLMQAHHCRGAVPGMGVTMRYVAHHRHRLLSTFVHEEWRKSASRREVSPVAARAFGVPLPSSKGGRARNHSRSKPIRHFEISTEGIRQLNLPRRAALGFEDLRRANED